MSKIFLSCTTAEFGHLRDRLAVERAEPDAILGRHPDLPDAVLVAEVVRLSNLFD